LPLIDGIAFFDHEVIDPASGFSFLFQTLNQFQQPVFQFVCQTIQSLKRILWDMVCLLLGIKPGD
jgi:hypothetical protein